MSLITAEELGRALCIGVFGGAAGVCTLAFPGSALWLVPAGLAVGGCALTVPEVRSEIVAAVRQLPPLPLMRQITHLPKMIQSHTARLPAADTPPAAATPPTAATLVETLESTPHRLIIGHTRGGKTTLMHHMATEWAAAGQRVLVGDPDAAPGLWPGCEVRGAGDDVAAIGELLTIVAGEVATRRVQRAQGVRRFAPLHLVIDEAQDVLPAIEGGLDLFEDVARRGGKLNIRMTVGVQDKQVATLGLKGKSELLRNLQVADVLKAPDGRRVAVLRDPETGARVRHDIPPLRDPESLIIPPATAPNPASKPASKPAPYDLLAALLDAPAPNVSTALGRQDAPATAPTSAPMLLGADVGAPTVSLALDAPTGHLTVNVSASASGAPGTRRRALRGCRLDMRRRRQLAQSAQSDTKKDELRRAYEARKAAGISHRKAFAELGGNSEESRAWWKGAPSPKRNV
ncbi:MAG: type IV secretory system conjugative DNA transfer family protein [Chloroflexales bacterium]